MGREDTRRSRSPRRRDQDDDRDRHDRRRSRSPRRGESTRERDRDHHDRRHRSRSKSPARTRHRSRSRSRSRRRRSPSASSSASTSSEHAHRKRRKRREKEGKRSKSEERERKARKKEKKAQKKKAQGSAAQWGKFGVISDADIFLKASEFHTWLVEERKINPETISKEQSKREFSRFVEDYNTATLPHEKYYNMESYDRRMAAMRAGEFVPPAEDSYDAQADMTALTKAHKKRSVDKETYLSNEQLSELRRVRNERVEASKMKLLGMDIKQNMGVRMDGTMFDE